MEDLPTGVDGVITNSLESGLQVSTTSHSCRTCSGWYPRTEIIPGTSLEETEMVSWVVALSIVHEFTYHLTHMIEWISIKLINQTDTRVDVDSSSFVGLPVPDRTLLYGFTELPADTLVLQITKDSNTFIVSLSHPN